VEVVASLS